MPTNEKKVFGLRILVVRKIDHHSYKIRARETALYVISADGIKFRKFDGDQVGNCSEHFYVQL
uniref:Uncharacterized protein n=1 Tax=Serratia phage Kevin TaxID=3161161 RepID=A0AAU8L0R8_9CAUD